MKKLVILLIINFSIVRAQNLVEHQLDYSSTFGFTDMVQVPGGDFMFSITAYPHADSSQAILMKVDESLNHKWAKRYKGLNRDDFACITLLNDGNLIIGGAYRQQATQDIGGSIYKIDTAGNVLWSKFYSGSFDDRTIKVFEQSDGSLMVFIRQGVSNQPTKVLHVNSNGGIISKKTIFNDSKGISAEDVCVSPNETYYIVGMFIGTQSQSNLFIASVDDQGINWYKSYDFGRSITCSNIDYSSNGRLLVGGTIDHPTNSNTDNYFAASLDVQGNMLWGKEYTATSLGSNWISDLCAIPNGGMAAFGRYAHSGISNSMMFTTDSNGVVQSSAGHATGSGSISSIGMRILNNGYLIAKQNNTSSNVLYNANELGVVACNNTNFELTDTALTATATSGTPSSNISNVTAMTLNSTVFPVIFNDTLSCELLVSIPEIDTKDMFKAYPVPANGRLYIDISPDLNDNAKITLCDIQGRTVGTYNINGTTKIELDLSEVIDGLYFVHLQTSSKVYSKKIIVSKQ